MDSLKDSFIKYYGMWVFAGLIVSSVSLAVVWWRGSLGDILTELLISMIIESFFFPFNLLVSSYINPLSVICRFAVFIFLIFLVRTL